jgi:hypothetical protein
MPCLRTRRRALQSPEAVGPGRSHHHDSLALKGAGVGHAIRPNQAVDAELCIVDGIPKVSTIAPSLHLITLHVLDRVQEALVHPIPDEAALHPTRCSTCGRSIHERTHAVGV